MPAKGDLANKKVFPSIYSIFKYGGEQLSENSIVVGYSRTNLTKEQFHAKLATKIPDLADTAPTNASKKFKDALFYVSGEYSGAEGYVKLRDFIKATMQKKFNTEKFNRVFYLALPPEKFSDAAEGLSKYLHDENFGYNRLVIEKPFGSDTESCKKLLKQIRQFWVEDKVYRIDHFLGKEMVAGLTSMKFGNPFVLNLCNKEHVEYVEITLYEDIGTEGRSGYFDKNGIIRDVMQNHMIQIFSLVAMDCPKSNCPKGIRDAKVELLKCVSPVDINEVLVGQYTGDKLHNKKGYLEDEGVAKDSIVPTFAAVVLRINNDTWKGVPFILKCGKAMNEKKTDINIHLLSKPNAFLPKPPSTVLSICVQPGESVDLTFLHKKPGLTSNTCLSNLTLSYKNTFGDIRIPDAYEALFMDVLSGNSSNFVRQDELECAWKLITPVLQSLENNKVRPEPYPYFSQGPKSLESFIYKCIHSKQNANGEH